VSQPTASGTVDLAGPRRIHVVGVGGPGMNPIAAVLAAQGHDVSGTDIKESYGLDRLRALGVSVTVGHDPHLVSDRELVTRSTAIPDDNVELVEARRLDLEVLSRAQMLSAICSLRRTVAVGGTHGKTTTTSMLALILVEAGMNPGFIIGGDLNEIGSGSAWDERGDWFVVEADESDGTFTVLGAEAVLVTNVDRDHLEFHGSFENLIAEFERFCSDAPGPRIVCVDDPVAAAVGARVGAVGYGRSETADYRLVDLEYRSTGVMFSVRAGDRLHGPVRLPVPGLHNALNAVGAMAMALELGADPEAAVRALERFAGVARRFEFRGDAAGVRFVDDYAHLATEVQAAVAAARSCEPRRVVAVFQPHRYSRTAAVWRDFADAFTDADVVVVTGIYSAGEDPRPGITGELVVEAVTGAHPGTNIHYVSERDELAGFMAELLTPGDLCLSLGAGDLTNLPDEVISLLGSADG